MIRIDESKCVKCHACVKDCVVHVLRQKENGLPIFDPEREKEVIARGAAAVEDPVLRSYYVRFLSETMAISRAYQSRLLDGMRVAYSGTVGAFAHIAAGKEGKERL